MFTRDLNLLKYTDLQKLAKSAGIRANQKNDKLINALKTHYIESESFEKDESKGVTKHHVSLLRGNIKNETVVRSPRHSYGVSKSSPFVKKMIERKSGGQNEQTPNQTGGKKRRRTFELDEASVQGNTPTIDKEQSKEPSSQISVGSGKNTQNAPKRQRTNTFDRNSPSIPITDVNKTKTPTPTRVRKRHSTFELEEATLQGSTPTIDGQSEAKTKQGTSQNTPVASEKPADHPAKRLRRSNGSGSSTPLQLCNGKDGKISSSSPSTKSIIESMGANGSSTERRERLLSAINKKVQGVAGSTKSSHPSQIPRYTTILVSKNKETENPVTPGNKDWKKIHNKEFSKFDSIDVYLNKKKQRQDQLTSSAKKKLLPFGSPTGKAKPAVVKPVGRNPRNAKIFQPQVMTTKNISFNFGKVSASTSKTPSRNPITPAKRNTPAALHRSSVQRDAQSKIAAGRATPFKFTGNSSFTKQAVPGKAMFDLKASLARPMTWKPHTGKLQPMDCNKEQPVQTRKPKVKLSHRELAGKTRGAQVKNVRRAAVVDRRSNQKYIDMMRKRGLLA